METPCAPNNSADNNNKADMNSNTSTMLDNIYSLVIKLNDQSQKLHTADNEKDSLRNLISSIEKLMKNDTAKKTDNINVSKINDWSMHFDSNSTMSISEGRPSLVVQQSLDNDVLTIIKNSESRTWDALDLIIKRMNDQSSKLDSLLLLTKSEQDDDHHRQLSSKISNMCLNPTMASPLVDVIDLHDETFPNDNGPSAPLDYNQDQNHSTTSLEREAIAAMISFDDHVNTPSNIQTTDLISGSQLNNAGVALAADSDDAGVIHRSLSHQTSSQNEQLQTEQPNNINNIIDTHNVKKSRSSRKSFREFHLSKLDPSCSTDRVFQYISSKCEITSNELRVFRLTKKGQNISHLKFVNFKIEITDDYSELINSENFWPKHCIISPFKRKDVCQLLPHRNDDDFLSARVIHPSFQT